MAGQKNIEMTNETKKTMNKMMKYFYSPDNQGFIFLTFPICRRQFMEKQLEWPTKRAVYICRPLREWQRFSLMGPRS